MTLTRSEDTKLAFPSLRDRVSAAEWSVRVDLAAAYRLSAHFGMEEMTRNHISARVPDAQGEMLVKPASLSFSEVTASNLVKKSFAGEKRGDSPMVIVMPARRTSFSASRLVKALRRHSIQRRSTEPMVLPSTAFPRATRPVTRLARLATSTATALPTF